MQFDYVFLPFLFYKQEHFLEEQPGRKSFILYLYLQRAAQVQKWVHELFKNVFLFFFLKTMKYYLYWIFLCKGFCSYANIFFYFFGGIHLSKWVSYCDNSTNQKYHISECLVSDPDLGLWKLFDPVWSPWLPDLNLKFLEAFLAINRRYIKIQLTVRYKF